MYVIPRTEPSPEINIRHPRAPKRVFVYIISDDTRQSGAEMDG